MPINIIIIIMPRQQRSGTTLSMSRLIEYVVDETGVAVPPGVGKRSGEQEADDARVHAQHVGAGGGGGDAIIKTITKTVNTRMVWFL